MVQADTFFLVKALEILQPNGHISLPFALKQHARRCIQGSSILFYRWHELICVVKRLDGLFLQAFRSSFLDCVGKFLSTS